MKKAASPSPKPRPTPRAAKPQPPSPFPIVGIGASAGGLEAVSHFIAHLPPDLPLGLVLVQHLDPDHASALTEVLSRVSPLPVWEVRSGMKVQPGHLYVIPPNKKLSIKKGTLRLLPRRKEEVAPNSIDYFFASLAADQGPRAIGIVLSGTGTDGTAGLQLIQRAGGTTFAQDQASSRFPGMPASAAAQGHADYILAPEAIAASLSNLAHSPPLPRTSEPQLPPPTLSDEGFAQICTLLRNHAGVDFSHYKPATLQRRIARRMVLQKTENLPDYLLYLRSHPEELGVLLQDILICVTKFFRDPKLFEGLKKKVFPKILKNRRPTEPIRLWVAGCSTGEEAYSLIIALVEFLEKENFHCPIQLFGTDINETVLRTARMGLYPERIKEDLSPERLRRFFTKTEGGFRINKSIRDSCMFARHNLFEDPPFSHVDLVSCRNVLIYFDATLQKRVMPVLHYALKPQGHLILGTAESVGSFADLFAITDAKYRIYEKKFTHIRPLTNAAHIAASIDRQPGHRPLQTLPSLDSVLSEARKQADAIILSQFVPPGVVVNSRMEILQFRGRTGPFLENAPGEASLNLLKMARQSLAIELRPLFAKSTEQKLPSSKDGISLRYNNHLFTVTLRVIPIFLASFPEPFFLVLFEEQAPPPLPLPKNNAQLRDLTLQRELATLKTELASSKLSLQCIISEQEASNEELRAANEEILSSNEELYSTNEEMETATEELQSTNEELITLNEELQNRNLELQELSDDMVNLFGTVDLSIIMLSDDLRIRRFTPKAVKLLNILPSDIGRPISDLKIKLLLPNLIDLIHGVLESLSVKELDVQDTDHRWFFLRIRPYKTADNRINGVVLTLQDIDALKKNLAETQAARSFAEAIVSTMREPLLILDHHFKVKLANRSFYRCFHTKAESTEGRPLQDLADGAWTSPPLHNLLAKVLPNKTSFEDFRFDQEFPLIGPKSLLLNGRRIAPGPDQPALILLAMEDITGKSSPP